MIHVVNKTHSKLSTLVAAFDAGSRVELKNNYNSGIAHMLEHCMFKGTSRRGWLQIQKDIGFIGGDINAFTSHELVAYHITVPYENLEVAVEIMSDIVTNSTVPEEEFCKEKEVVIEEEISRSDDIYSYIWNNFSKAYFDNYLSVPVIGTQDSIADFTSDEVKDFYKRFCGIENSVISLCTNTTKKSSKELLNRYFGKQTGKVFKHKDFLESTYKKSNIIEITKPGIEHTYVWIGYPGFTVGSDMSPAANLMMCILGGGMDSRLFAEVRERRGLAYGIDAHNNEWNNGSLSLISSSTRDTNVEEMLEVIDDEVNNIKENFIDSEELQRAKNKMKSAFYHIIEDSHGIAMRGIREKIWGLKPLDSLIEDINNVSLEDIKSVSNTIFDDNKRLTLICRGE